MPHLTHRNKSWSSKPMGVLPRPQDDSAPAFQETPVKYYIAEQVLKDAFRRQQYVLQELQNFHEQNLLLEKIKGSLARTKSNSLLEEDEEQEGEDSFSYCEKSLSQKETQRITRKRFLGVEDSNSVITKKGKYESRVAEDVLLRVRTKLGKEDHDFIMRVIRENRDLERELDNQERLKPLLDQERKSAESLRLQIIKYQNKISKMDKDIAAMTQRLEMMKDEKLNYSKSMGKIQSQQKINTMDSTTILIQQKIIKNERKKLDLEKQMVGNLKVELDQQMYQIEKEWKKYSPEEATHKTIESVGRCWKLLKQEYDRIEEFNREIESFNSKLCIM